MMPRLGCHPPIPGWPPYVRYANQARRVLLYPIIGARPGRVSDGIASGDRRYLDRDAGSRRNSRRVQHHVPTVAADPWQAWRICWRRTAVHGASLRRPLCACALITRTTWRSASPASRRSGGYTFLWWGDGSGNRGSEIRDWIFQSLISDPCSSCDGFVDDLQPAVDDRQPLTQLLLVDDQRRVGEDRVPAHEGEQAILSQERVEGRHRP